MIIDKKIFGPGQEKSKQTFENDGNYKEEILVERDFGSNPNGEFSVMPTNAPIECSSVYPNFGLETDLGVNPNGDMFGAPAPDKLSMIERGVNYPSETETFETLPFSSLTLEHDLEEGTRGEL